MATSPRKPSPALSRADEAQLSKLLGKALPQRQDALDAFMAWLLQVAWRHRHHLLPYAVALGLTAESAELHSRAPYLWWVPIAIGGVAAAAVVAFPGVLGRLRQGSRREQVYLVVAAAATVALTAAISAAGPRPVLLQGMLALSVAMSIPWSWRYRIRSRHRAEVSATGWRARVRARQEASRYATTLAHHFGDIQGLGRAKLISSKRDNNGVTLHLECPGYTPGSVDPELVESYLGSVPPGTVRIEADPRQASRFYVRIVPRSPLLETLPWPGRTSTTVTDPALLGRDEKGEEVTLTLYDRERGAAHVLLAGITGSGKTGGVRVLLSNLVACRDVEVWIGDCKNGMDYAPWRDHVAWMAYGPEAVKEMLKAARQEVDRQAEAARQRGENPHQATPEHPLLALILDEIGELDKEALGVLASIASLGRAPGVLVITATQQPTKEVLDGTRLRRELPTKICMRLDADLTNSVLGSRKVGEGWRPDRLSRAAPGSFLLLAEGHESPSPSRFYRPEAPVGPPAASLRTTIASRYQQGASVADVVQLAPAEKSRPADSMGAVLWALEQLGGEARTGAIEERARFSAAAVTNALNVLAGQGRVRPVKRGWWKLERPA